MSVLSGQLFIDKLEMACVSPLDFNSATDKVENGNTNNRIQILLKREEEGLEISCQIWKWVISLEFQKSMLKSCKKNYMRIKMIAQTTDLKPF